MVASDKGCISDHLFAFVVAYLVGFHWNHFEQAISANNLKIFMVHRGIVEDEYLVIIMG